MGEILYLPTRWTTFLYRNTANKAHLNAFDFETLSQRISTWTLTFVNQLTIVIFIYKLLAVKFFPPYPFLFTSQPYLSSTSRDSSSWQHGASQPSKSNRSTRLSHRGPNLLHQHFLKKTINIYIYIWSGVPTPWSTPTPLWCGVGWFWLSRSTTIITY